MTYTAYMAIRIAIFAFPIAAALVLVELLNRFEAAPGVAAIALGLTALTSGALVGGFADHLPSARRSPHTHRVAGLRRSD